MKSIGTSRSHATIVSLVLLATSLGWSAASSAYGQTAEEDLQRDRVAAADTREQAQQPTPAVHLEKPGQPPAPPAPRRVSPPPLLTRGGYVSVQVNVDEFGNNIVDDAANEPTIAVDPTNPNIIAIGWRQFDSIWSNFREAGWG